MVSGRAGRSSKRGTNRCKESVVIDELRTW